MPAKLTSLDIVVNGLLSPSLLASINRAEALLRSFGVSAKTQSVAMSRVYAAAFGPISPAFDKATASANRFHSALQNISEIAAGVSIGDMLTAGIERGIGLIDQMGKKLIELGEHASDAASKFELMQRGMGALLRDQGFASGLLDELQQAAFKSPFQLTDLGNVARALTGRGMGKEQLYGATTELGDISAGLGGSAEVLDRLTLAYGEAFDEKTISKRILNQFSKAGVPMMDAVMQSLGLDPKKEGEIQRFFKMVHDKQVTFHDLDKAIYNLTHDGGLFTDGMQNFAKTFQGILTTFQDYFGRAERDFGFIINDWVANLLQFVNSGDMWDQVHDWMLNLRQMSQSVLSIVSTMPKGAMDAAFAEVQGLFDQFNAFISQFFTLVEIPNQGNVMVLNATGDAKIKEAFDHITSLFKQISDFITSDAMRRVMGFTGTALTDGLKFLFTTIEEMVYLADDLMRGDIGKFMSDFKKYEIDIPRAKDHKEELQSDLINRGLMRMPWGDAPVPFVPQTDIPHALDENTKANYILSDTITALNQVMQINADDALNPWRGQGFNPGGNYGLHGGYSDNPNETYYEHPDTEGHSSQYGPEGNRLGYGYGVGLGKSLQAQGHPRGSWVKIRTPNGREIWRQVNETSARDHGIEFVTPHTDESSYGSGKSEIIDSSATKPDGASITINNHIYAMDSHGVDRVMRDHAETMAEHIRRVWDGQNERSAVV